MKAEPLGPPLRCVPSLEGPGCGQGLRAGAPCRGTSRCPVGAAASARASSSFCSRAGAPCAPGTFPQTLRTPGSAAAPCSGRGEMLLLKETPCFYTAPLLFASPLLPLKELVIVSRDPIELFPAHCHLSPPRPLSRDSHGKVINCFPHTTDRRGPGECKLLKPRRAGAFRLSPPLPLLLFHRKKKTPKPRKVRPVAKFHPRGSGSTLARRKPRGAGCVVFSVSYDTEPLATGLVFWQCGFTEVGPPDPAAVEHRGCSGDPRETPRLFARVGSCAR